MSHSSHDWLLHGTTSSTRPASRHTSSSPDTDPHATHTGDEVGVGDCRGRRNCGAGRGRHGGRSARWRSIPPPFHPSCPALPFPSRLSCIHLIKSPSSTVINLSLRLAVASPPVLPRYVYGRSSSHVANRKYQRLSTPAHPWHVKQRQTRPTLICKSWYVSLFSHFLLFFLAVNYKVLPSLVFPQSCD